MQLFLGRRGAGIGRLHFRLVEIEQRWQQTAVHPNSLDEHVTGNVFVVFVQENWTVSLQKSNVTSTKLSSQFEL